MRKKAQASTEYLIILAVVIVIALIVVSVMGGIPGIGVGAGSRASASYWATADVAITSYAITDDSAQDDASIIIRNNLRDSINLTSISLGGTSLSITATTLAPGGTITKTSTNIGNPCGGAAQPFSASVSISYTNLETGASYTFTGDGTKLEGTCA